jgi:2-keto-4-pentenoate hydratase
MANSNNLTQLANKMLSDYDARTPGNLFAEGMRLSLTEAYGVQMQVAQLRELRGEHLAGYKIGCVCQGNQDKNGLTHPVYGRLWSTEQHVTNVTLPIDAFANLAIEGEIAISLRYDIEPKQLSIQDIAEAVDEVFTVIELHNLVLHGDHPTGAELIANNAIHAGVVYSSGVRPPLTGDCSELSVALDGRIAEHWVNRRWPNDVLSAVPWLVSELAKDNQQLKAGQKILTGAWGPPLPLERPHRRGTLARQSGNGHLHETTNFTERAIINRVNVMSTLFGSVTALFTHH